MDSFASLCNAFQRPIALRDFPHAEPKSCWKQFKPFPSGLPLCGERGKLFATALTGSLHRFLGSHGHFIYWFKIRAKQGRALESRRRERSGRSLCLPLWVSSSAAALRAPDLGLTQPLLLIFLGKSHSPFTSW